MWLVNDTKGRSWTPSEVGRAVKVSTYEAASHLRRLADQGYVASDSRGAWTRYSSRR